MDELIQAITPAIETLANFFGTSVEYLQEHLVEYVLEYGKYKYAINISNAIGVCFGLWVAILVIGGFTLVAGIFYEYTSYKGALRDSIKWVLLLGIATLVLLSLCGVIWFLCTTYIPYHASPEIWSATEALKLITTSNTR